MKSPASLHHLPHVVLDLETTGLSPKSGDRVIEVGAVRIEAGTVVGEFHTLVHTDRPIPWYVEQVHGISNRMLEGHPPAVEVIPRFLDFLGTATLVAHNAPFDVGFLRHECALLGRHLPNPSCCTVILSRKLLPQLPNHRLETVARHLLGDLPADVRLHRALADARLTALVWLKLQELRKTG